MRLCILRHSIWELAELPLVNTVTFSRVGNLHEIVILITFANRG